LTHVVSRECGTENELKDPLYGKSITEIQWHADDALPFPVCVSSVTDEEHERKPVEKVSVALGNIVLADHGLTLREPTIKDGTVEAVPPFVRTYSPRSDQDRCQEAKPGHELPRFHPSLAERPLTFSAVSEEQFLFQYVPQTPAEKSTVVDALNRNGFPVKLKECFADNGITLDEARLSVQGATDEWTISNGTRFFPIRLEDGLFSVYGMPKSATSEGRVDLNSAGPSVHLEVDKKPEELPWFPGRDLLDNGPEEHVFVVDVAEEGTATIRFGDDQYGAFPDPGLKFNAVYRVGNGTRGNIGSDSLVHVVSDVTAIDEVSNRLPAAGGTDPENIEVVRQRAPFAFRRQERAVTLEDYAEVSKRHPQVQNAVGTFRWTGSWHTVFLSVDRKDGLPVSAGFQQEMRAFLERYRLAGYDIVVDSPRPVSLEIDMQVCVKPGVFSEDVKKALLDTLSNRRLPDGRLGVFHPDNLTFGQTVYLSRIYQAALAVDGVRSVSVSKFQRQGVDSTEALDAGKLVLGRLEIARLDNDPNFPDHGVFRISTGGGQ
jgi:hypothetical protein